MLSNKSEYMPLSESDVDLIKSDLYPKMKRTVVWLSAGLLCLNSLAPYMGTRFGGRPKIETMGYLKAFIFYSIISGCLIFYSYWSLVIVLRKDLENGRKCVFRTKISRKVWNGHQQFEIFFENVPNGFLRKKFIYPITESHKFHQGEVVALEYLERSAMLLRVSVEERIFKSL